MMDLSELTDLEEAVDYLINIDDDSFNGRETDSKCKNCDCYDEEIDEEFWTELDLYTRLCEKCFNNREKDPEECNRCRGMGCNYCLMCDC